MKNPSDPTEALKFYDDNPEALARDALDAEHIDVAADYVSRGRRFGAVSIAELEEKCTPSCRRVCRRHDQS